MAPSRSSDKVLKPGTTLDDAETQFEVGNVQEAISLALEALQVTGEGGDFELRALNLLGILHIEAGDQEEAMDYLQSAAKLDKDGTMDEKIGGGPDKFLFMAQISEEGGEETVGFFQIGAAALRKQLQAISDAGIKTPEQQASYEEKQEKLGGVLCAVTEVYMTDLSWEEDAEQRCEALITEAMMIAPKSPETWQTVANVRISQGRVDEAKTALKRSLDLWQNLPVEHPAVPPYPTRIGLARLLLEVELEQDAMVVLKRLVAEDETSVEAWYLGGWCRYLQGEKLRASATEPQAAEPQTWNSMWKSSWRWLAKCNTRYTLQGYEDDRMQEHVLELLQIIVPELGGPAEEGDEADWNYTTEEGDDDEDLDDDSDEEGGSNLDAHSNGGEAMQE